MPRFSSSLVKALLPRQVTSDRRLTSGSPAASPAAGSTAAAALAGSTGTGLLPAACASSPPDSVGNGACENTKESSGDIRPPLLRAAPALGEEAFPQLHSR